MLARELTEKFGGVASFTRMPAECRWKDGRKTEHDDVSVIEAMSETIEHEGGAVFGGVSSSNQAG